MDPRALDLDAPQGSANGIGGPHLITIQLFEEQHQPQRRLALTAFVANPEDPSTRIILGRQEEASVQLQASSSGWITPASDASHQCKQDPDHQTAPNEDSGGGHR
jgi:hypothetical protein